MKLPIQSSSQKKGRQGEIWLENFVVNTLGCIYHKVDGSDDFGIDGYIELVENTNVTGKLAAVQILHGDSYFMKKSGSYYKYVCEDKFLNYYLNSPVPVFIIIANQNFSLVKWARFDLENVFEQNSTSWYVEVSDNDNLQTDFADVLRRSVGKIFDYSSLMRQNIQINIELERSDTLIIAISKEEILTFDFLSIQNTFDVVSKNETIRSKFASSCNLCIYGYDDDPREIYEIDETIKWIKASMLFDIPWFYFLELTEYSGVRQIANCYVEHEVIENDGVNVTVEYTDKNSLIDFLHVVFGNINTYQDKFGISHDENVALSRKLCAFITQTDLRDDSNATILEDANV